MVFDSNTRMHIILSRILQHLLYNKDSGNKHSNEEMRNMANILPVSDLRNYNEVLKNCHKGEPVYLTKNGRGRFVVMDIEDYERERAEKKLLMKLYEAEEAVKDGEG